MRTLATQIRLRRLRQAHREYVRRLRAEPRPQLAEAAAWRLLELVQGLRRSWHQESALALARDGGSMDFSIRQVRRSLAAIEASVAAIQATAADPASLQDEFEELTSRLDGFLRELESAAAVPAGEQRLSA